MKASLYLLTCFISLHLTGNFVVIVIVGYDGHDIAVAAVARVAVVNNLVDHGLHGLLRE